MRSLLLPTVLLSLLTCSWAVNFPFEEAQLAEDAASTAGLPALSFGDASKPVTHPDCKAAPGTDAWPADEDWEKLGDFFSGSLLKPEPPAAVCYEDHPLANATACRDIKLNSGSTRFFIDDPLTVLTSWPQGDSCPLNPAENGTCTHGAFPEYVVNVTEVWQIQAAVNFARNNDLRLIIKNTGHDFAGRSVGYGSLSVWTHFLKQFEFIQEYTQGSYSGPAARVGAGLESWELYDHMAENEITLVCPGRYTVGVYGGWTQGGGHSALASTFGMGSDQVLSIQVVTADGRFVTADPEENSDLFYALRGGGPSTYGIVTSLIVKAHPPIVVKKAALAFGTSDTVSSSTFWAAIDIFHWFAQYITEVGGTSYTYVTYQGEDSFSFTADNEFPGRSEDEIVRFLQPLWDSLAEIGIPVKNITVSPTTNWAPSTNAGVGDSPGNSRFGSRLFPKRNWQDEEAFAEMSAAIRALVEATFTFHAIFMNPHIELAGWPGEDSGVNPAFRDTYMHADIFFVGNIEEDEPYETLMDALRKATPGGGAYINESDVEEPDFQESFFGKNYERLLGVKRERDPWGVFWAPSTVGSEGWAVKTDDVLASQNGPLCRVE
ncbi:uncharacterized protein DNG_02210 [Cephalotrichum gorgonifer]|uniref:FAD-binding PCMH-type domain-containing protein n=1 Tax=Cephalotrichum gorgonifer TaxID=2041049 RepID=A0AAE8MT35_9PEZI|nr:uncharacterized protein DNG_02210 [Cephalotrichum gorgonifer]